MKYRIISGLSKANSQDWEDFLVKHSQSNFFQSLKYFQFLDQIEGWSPFVYFVYSHDDQLVGLLCGTNNSEGKGIKGYLSSRIIVTGGPILHSDHVACLPFLIKRLQNDYKRKAIYIEFRNLFDTSVFRTHLTHSGFSYKGHLNYQVPLTNAEATRKRISKSKLRQINSSLKAGAEIREAGNESEIKQYYDILSELYKTKVKKPLPDISFFLNFYNSPELGKILLIIYRDQVIGGIVCPIYNSIIYEWFICGQDRQYKKVYPSVLATWAAIEYGTRNNLTFFDFLGAGSSQEDYGVREFKSKFGGDLLSFGRYVYVQNKMLYSLGKFGLKILGLLKLT